MISSFAVAGGEVANLDGLLTRLGDLIRAHDILRIKGMVALQGKPLRGRLDFRATSAGTVLRFSRGFSMVRASLADDEICSVRSERGTVRRHFSKSAPA